MLHCNITLASNITPSDVTSVSAFHVQCNILSGFPALLPSHVILPSDEVIAVSAVAVVRIRYNKSIVVVLLPLYEGNMTICSPSKVNVLPYVCVCGGGDTCSLVPLKYFSIFPCSPKSKS